MKRHLLTAGDLERDDATLVLDTAAEMARLTEGRSVKKLPTLRLANKPTLELTFDDITLEGYDHHPFIKFAIAI